MAASETDEKDPARDKDENQKTARIDSGQDSQQNSQEDGTVVGEPSSSGNNGNNGNRRNRHMNNRNFGADNCAFMFVDPDLASTSRDLMRGAISTSNYPLQNTCNGRPWLFDKEMALRTVSQCGAWLKLMPQIFREDREVVMCAVSGGRYHGPWYKTEEGDEKMARNQSYQRSALNLPYGRGFY